MTPVEHARSRKPRGGVEVTEEVLSYLDRHPGAADSLEGIVQWWLPQQRYETERERIGAALEVLVQKGLLVKRRLVDGTVVYGRRRNE
jgi:hypothetical protein